MTEYTHIALRLVFIFDFMSQLIQYYQGASKGNKVTIELFNYIEKNKLENKLLSKRFESE